MNTPLVSVVCLCYNHERFVEEAIRSVLNQTYPSIQLIVVDDYSLDGSRLVIQKLLTHHPLVEFVPCEKNLGNCRAFNTGLAKVAGEFVIDLSADDVLMPSRVELGVREFLGRGLNYGVHFSDAELISDTDVILGHHSDQFPHDSIPQGDVFSEILSRYFINSPIMMMRKQVFDRLGGYDEALAYEDFDFWVRSSRDFKYCYTPEALVRRRVVNSSLGKGQ